jgi:hypothetical protein
VEPQVAASLFQQFAAFGVALGGPQKKLTFLLPRLPGFSQNHPKSGLSGGPSRHRLGRLRSKNFEKSEKKACQPS